MSAEEVNGVDKPKLRLGVFKFASCDGCQLSLLDLEDELFELLSAVELSNFLEASSAVLPGPYDVALVEGSITTVHDQERILEIRASAKRLVTIGACATSGGIQALRNGANVGEWVASVYPSPDYISTLEHSTPISAHVPVDYELFGCPVNKHQLLEVLSAVWQDRKPRVRGVSVCSECKAKGTPCVLVTRGTACLGPLTHAGCEALCPTYGRGCFGCYGPQNTCNADALVTHLQHAHGQPDVVLSRLLNTYAGQASAFAQARKRLTT